MADAVANNKGSGVADRLRSHSCLVAASRARSMNPFRRTTSGRERLSALAERLIVSMAGAKVELPAEATPDALWTLGIAVAGWWLRGDPEVDSVLRETPLLPVLFEVFGSVKALPLFAATAARATDYVGLSRGSAEFANVVQELGAAKLQTALGNVLFGRLQTQVLSAFPSPPDLAETVSPAKACARFGVPISSREAAGTGRLAGRGKPVDTPQRRNTKVSAPTMALLRTLYREDDIRRILKG